MKPSDDLRETIPFADNMSDEAFGFLKDNLKRNTVAPGADILHPGDAVNGVYLVQSGTIRVYYVGPDGREGTLYWIEAGESCILALNSLFTEMPYPAFAAAEAEGVEILTLSGAVFRELFSKDAAVQKFLFEQLSSRVYSLLKMLEETMRLPQEERLILLLLGQADEEDTVHLSQENLARHLGTIREVVSRLLRNLASQGLIELAPKKVKLLERKRLEAMASAEEADF